jgi:hypothetical protein
MNSRGLLALGLLSWLPACQIDLSTPPAQSAPPAPVEAASAATPLPAASAAPVADSSAAPAASSAAPAEAPPPAGGCRSALAFPTTPGDPPAPGDAPAAALATAPDVVRACEALATRSHRRADRVIEPLSDEEKEEAFEPLVQCYRAGKGAWTFEVTAARSDQVRDHGAGGGVTVSLHARAVFIEPDGAVQESSQTIKILSSTVRFSPVVHVAAPRVFDWDDDSRGEFYFQERHTQEESGSGEDGSRFWTFTARRGRVVEFQPSAARATRITDVDGDGRPDLVFDGPWRTTGPSCGAFGDATYRGPESLLHSLAGGSFSAQDAVAQGFIARQCRVRPDHLFAGESAGSKQELPPFLIGCARWWGRSAAEVTEQIGQQYPDSPAARCYPKKELVRAAHIAPPQPFRLRCP